MSSRARRRRDRMDRRRRAAVFGAAVAVVAVGLVAVAVTFAPLVSAGVDVTPDPEPELDLGVTPEQVASTVDGTASTAVGAAAASVTGLYVYIEAVAHAGRLDRLRARWLPVHTCEQGDDWYVDGYTAHGHFQGGMGHNADNYISIRGHSANLDSPDEQMFIAEVAHRMGVRWAPSCEARLGPEL